MRFKQYFHLSDRKEDLLDYITNISKKYLFDKIKRFIISLGNKNYAFDNGFVSITDDNFSLNTKSKWVGDKIQITIFDGKENFETSINPVFFNARNTKNYFNEIEIRIKKNIINMIKKNRRA